MHHIHISVYGVKYSNGNMGNNKRKEKEEMTLAEVHVCRLCGKKIDQVGEEKGCDKSDNKKRNSKQEIVD